MIDTLGPYLLVLIFGGHSIAIQEMTSWESCKAALTQLEPVRQIHGYCIAKELKE
jgi:hypothetical protein